MKKGFKKSELPGFHIPIDRRRFFKSMALASAAFTLPGYLAEALTLTPQFRFGMTVPGQTRRYTPPLFWNEVPKDANGNIWGTTDANDMVLTGITDAAQRSSVIKDYTAVPGTTTGEVQTTWDIVMGLTPMQPTYPGGGTLLVAGKLVAGPAGGNPRYQVVIPVYAGYSYEIYGNPTLA